MRFFVLETNWSHVKLASTLVSEGVMVTHCEQPEMFVADYGFGDVDLLVLFEDALVESFDIAKFRHLQPSTPIAIICTVSDPMTAIQYLAAGFDLVLSSSIGVEDQIQELRMCALSGHLHRGSSLSLGPLRLAFSNQTVEVNGVDVELCPIEYEILEYLALRMEQVCTVEEITDHLSGLSDRLDVAEIEERTKSLTMLLNRNCSLPTFRTLSLNGGYQLKLLKLPAANVA